jgi:starch synthase (maltosyl-transferring)
VQSFLFHANVATRLAAPLCGRPWVVGGLRVAERQRRWHLGLDRATAGLACGSVCVSEGVRRFSIATGRLDPDRLVVIPNGVDPSLFDQAQPADRASLNVPKGAFLTLYVGRFDPQKGLDVLLEAAARVAVARPDWHLALAGDGPERDRLRHLAAAKPALDGRVHWLGQRDDVPSLLKAAALLVLPSLWEGMPNVVLEAMAARTAVVATAVEGTEDLVTPGKTGWLVPPGESEPLAEALVAAATNTELRDRFAQAARRRVEAEFTPERVVQAYERLWARVLGYAEPFQI